MQAVLETEGLVKRYRQGGKSVEALNGLNLLVPRGGVYGILGPNGAGKSTLLRIATGLVHPTDGQIRLFGEIRNMKTLRRVGALVEAPRFYPFMTARETLGCLARLSGAGRRNVSALLERVGLGAAADRRVDGFSLGMKQRLGIAAALIAEPDVIILDEPTNGMDPAGILEIRMLVRDLADRDGRTVILSSHLLDEVQRVCDRVAILAEGNLKAEGQIDELLGQGERLHITAERLDVVAEKAGARAERLNNAVLVDLARSEAPQFLAEIVMAGAGLMEARWETPDLESLFFAETGDTAC